MSVSVKDVKAKIERLRARLTAAASDVDETSSALAKAEIEGREANGKLAALQGVIFRRDVLAKEVERLERVELPGAEQAERERGRQKALALAYRIHKNRLLAAAELDAALAAAEAAWRAYDVTHQSYFGTLHSAGAFRRRRLDDALAQQAGWAAMPTLMRLLGARPELRRHAQSARDAEAKLHAPMADGGGASDDTTNDEEGAQA